MKSKAYIVVVYLSRLAKKLNLANEDAAINWLLENKQGYRSIFHLTTEWGRFYCECDPSDYFDINDLDGPLTTIMEVESIKFTLAKNQKVKVNRFKPKRVWQLL